MIIQYLTFINTICCAKISKLYLKQVGDTMHSKCREMHTNSKNTWINPNPDIIGKLGNIDEIPSDIEEEMDIPEVPHSSKDQCIICDYKSYVQDPKTAATFVLSEVGVKKCNEMAVKRKMNVKFKVRLAIIF